PDKECIEGLPAAAACRFLLYPPIPPSRPFVPSDSGPPVSRKPGKRSPPRFLPGAPRCRGFSGEPPPAEGVPFSPAAAASPQTAAPPDAVLPAIPEKREWRPPSPPRGSTKQSGLQPG